MKIMGLISLLIALVLYIAENELGYNKISSLKYFFIAISAILSIWRVLNSYNKK